MGNQLFIYAYGQALAHKLNQNVVYDFYGFRGGGLIRSVKEIVKFMIGKPPETNDEMSEFASDYGKCHPVIHAIPLLYAKVFKENKTFKGINPAIYPRFAYIDGYWQNEKHFKEIEEHIVAKLRVKRVHSINIQHLIEAIDTSQSVCVHVRLGDYVESEAVAKKWNVCNVDYYQRSINVLEEKTGRNINHYYFFSDNINWCKKNLAALSINSTFVDVPGSYPNLDLELMMHCKHFIIANSSYSWWAAWLGRYPEKIVICPKRWTNYDDHRNVSPQCDNWIKN